MLSWPTAFAPIVDGYPGLGDQLNELPMLVTTAATTLPPKRDMARCKTIRGRLHDYPGLLAVAGLARRDVLEDAWEQRDRVIEFCQHSRVDIMVVHQFARADRPGELGAATARAFEQYALYADAGFDTVAMTIPPDPRYQAEYIAFCISEQVPVVAVESRTDGGALEPLHLAGLQRIHAGVPVDVPVMVFGVSAVVGMAQLARVLTGRRVLLASKVPYFASIYRQLMPHNMQASGIARSQVFASNVRWMQDLAVRVHAINPDPN